MATGAINALVGLVLLFVPTNLCGASLDNDVTTSPVQHLGPTTTTSLVGYRSSSGSLEHGARSPTDHHAEAIMASYQKLYANVTSAPGVKYRIPPGLLDVTSRSYKMKFELIVIDIFNLDDVKQIMTVVVYLIVSWRQVGIAWNPKDYHDIDVIFVDTASLWHPQLVAIMGDKDSILMDFEETLTVSYEGWVKTSRPYYLSSACEIVFDKYPFDYQTCSIGFYPLGTMFKPTIDVVNPNFTLKSLYSRGGEWMLENVSFSVVTSDESIGVAVVFPRYNFTVRRQRTYYVITIIFPMVLTSVMIPLVFLIPSETGEKISYLVAIFTSCAIFLNFISDVMPRSLSYWPYLSILLVEVFIEGLLAVLATIVVAKLDQRQQSVDNNPSSSLHGALREFFTKSQSNQGKKSAVVSKGQSSSIVLKSHQLDIFFFVTFTFLQLSFLTFLFLGTGWLDK